MRDFEPRTDSPTLRAATEAFARTFLDAVMPELRLAARGCGYALAVHGSLARDIDLIAIPWAKHADTADLLVARLLGVLAGKLGRAVYRESEWTDREHGRRAVLFILPGMSPEIDFSVMPCVTEETVDA